MRSTIWQMFAHAIYRCSITTEPQATKYFGLAADRTT